MRLKFAFSPNPRIEPLLDGTVPIEGVEAEWEHGHPGELHLRHMTRNDCAVFEFSISNHMILRDRPNAYGVRWAALPIFLSKALMWLKLYVNEKSGVRSLADLRGKRVGVPDFHMTAALWMRIVLKELYGIQAGDIEWFNGRPLGLTHGSGATEALNPAISLTRLEQVGELDRMLQAGEIDVAYGDGVTTPVTVGGDVRPFELPDNGAQVIRDFQAQTGVTPVNHVLMAQQQLLEEHPGLAMSLFNAFERSKQTAYERARKAAPGYLLFAEDEFARQAALFGEDPFPSGIAANRKMLEMVADEECAEGLVRARPNVESLFAPATLGT